MDECSIKMGAAGREEVGDGKMRGWGGGRIPRSNLGKQVLACLRSL